MHGGVSRSNALSAYSGVALVATLGNHRDAAVVSVCVCCFLRIPVTMLWFLLNLLNSSSFGAYTLQTYTNLSVAKVHIIPSLQVSLVFHGRLPLRKDSKKNSA